MLPVLNLLVLQNTYKQVFSTNNQKLTTVIFLTFAKVKSYKFLFYVIFILLYFFMHLYINLGWDMEYVARKSLDGF